MERLTTHKNENYNQPGCNDCSDYRWRNCKKSGEIKDCIKRLTWIRLLVIEDIIGNDYDLDRLRELVQADREGRYIIMRDAERNGVARLKELSEADREGRCVILSEPMKPLVYKPNDTDVYCPNCGAKMDLEG